MTRIKLIISKDRVFTSFEDEIYLSVCYGDQTNTTLSEALRVCMAGVMKLVNIHYNPVIDVIDRRDEYVTGDNIIQWAVNRNP